MTIDELYDVVLGLDSNTIMNKYLKKFDEIYWSLSTDEKQSKLEIISKGFFHILKNFHGMPSEDETDKINELITAIAVTQIPSNKKTFNCGQYLFFQLMHDLENYDTSKSIEVYDKLCEDISKVDWIFSLSKNNQLIYPIGTLMYDVIDKKSFDEKDLFNLSFLLRIYVRYDNEDTDIEEKINNLSKKYNLKCLDYIRRGGEQLLTSKNVNENGIMIFRHDNGILLRSVRKNYFDLKESIEEERDSKGNIIAYFIEYSLPANTRTFNGLDDFFQNAEANCEKFKFIQRLYREGHFNNFYKDAIYLDSQTHKYEFLNRYGWRDEKVISKVGKSYNNDEKGFFELLQDPKECYSLRQSIIWRRDSFDILTLDFFSEFSRLNKKTLNFNLEEISESDFLQNSLFKQYFESYGDCDEKIIYKYIEFIKRNIFDLNKLSTKMKSDMKLIFPYRPYVPDCFSDYCFLYKSMLEDIQGEFCQFEILDRRLGNYVEVDGNQVVLQNIEKEVLNSEDIERLKLPNVIKKGFFDRKSGILYYDEQLTVITEKLFEFNKGVENYNLTYDLLKSKSEDSLNKIINLISSIKLSIDNYTVFGVSPLVRADSILWYKLLWHFTVMGWNSEQIDSFLDLVLVRHYTGCALQYQETVMRWYQSINQMISDDSNLVFRKEKMRDTTLDNYIAEISTSLGGKQQITQTDFDKSKVSIKNSKLYYKGREIKKIVMLVDNIMGGTSLKKALHYYFIDNSEKDVHEKYFPYSPTIRKNGLKDLNVKVIVKAIWSFPDVKIDTKKLNDDSFKLSIESEETIGNQYKCSDEVKKITRNLYGEVGQAEYLIFRQKNMPHKTVFPKKVTDTTNLIGLFNRSKELN